MRLFMTLASDQKLVVKVYTPIVCRSRGSCFQSMPHARGRTLIEFASGEAAANGEVVSPVYPEDGPGRLDPSCRKELLDRPRLGRTSEQAAGGKFAVVLRIPLLCTPYVSPIWGHKIGERYRYSQRGLDSEFPQRQVVFHFPDSLTGLLLPGSNGVLNRARDGL